MRNGWKKVLVTVIVLAAIFGFAAGSYAESNLTGEEIVSGVPAVNFIDLDQASWAKKNIIRMKVRGIVDGYKDGTFRPNAEVRQAEAIIMAVNELGLNQQAAEWANQSTVALPQELGTDLPLWAKGYVAVAWQQGLIRSEENNFKWNAPANRAWIAQLTVRMIGLEQEALQMGGFLSNFTDDRDFPEWARGYIAIALDKEIFAGYSDGSFRPARGVTRAELATILAKSEQYMNLDNVIYGLIEDINKDNVIVEDTNFNLYRIYIADGAWIFNGDQQIQFRDLREGDRAALILVSADNTGFIDLMSRGVSQETVNGEVVRIDTEKYEIRIEDEDGIRTTYEIDRDVEIEIEGDSNPRLRDIKAGNYVALQITDEKVTMIEVITENDEFVVGELYRVNTTDKTIRIEDRDGDLTTYNVDTDAVIQIPGYSAAKLEDLMTGNQVKLVLVDNEVTEIIQGKTREGKIRSVDTSDDTVKLERSSGSITTYDVSSDVKIEYGSKSLEIEDLKENDEVTLYIFNDIVYLIVVTNGS